jgi:hypothetical protein
MRTTCFLIAVFCAVQLAYAQDSAGPAFRVAIQNELLHGVDLGAPLKSSILDEATPSRKKNVGLAFFFSLAVPGMGELYVGDYSVGRFFTMAEAGLWLTYASFDMYGNWVRNDARSFARSHGGVNTQGKDDQYFVDVGNFIDIYEYNEKKLRDRQPDKLYAVSPEYFWKWDTDENRSRYRELRISHDRAFNNVRFVVAAVIVNHIVSAVHAARSAISHNKRLSEASLWNMHVSPTMSERQIDGLSLTVVRSF